MKTLKFHPSLVPMILNGSKTATWRLGDDKKLAVGDHLSLLNAQSGEPFAEVVITDVVETPFDELTEADKEGHEPYQSEAAMYRSFAGHYGQPVDRHTVVKIIKFQRR